MKSQDLEVMHRLGLSLGAEITPEELWRIVKEKITPVDMLEICQGCDWLELGYCIEGLKRLR